MKSPSENTAVLIFARSTKKEAEIKLSKGDHRDYTLANFLNQKTILIVNKTGLPHFLIDEEQQVGNTFGERLANAFQTVFDEGFENVISIGNDCVGLTADDILHTEDILEYESAVIGPDLRKGAYLIGMRKSVFNLDRFTKLPWQSKSTFHALTEYFPKYFLLEIKSDFNEIDDLKKVIAGLSSNAVKELLLKMTGLFHELDSIFIDEQYSLSYTSGRQERGPPEEEQ